MTHYSIEPRTRKYVKGYGFLSFGRNLSNKCIKQLMDNAIKKRTLCFKRCYKKVAHKAAEATREFIGNKITNKIAKSKPVPDVEESYSTREKRSIEWIRTTTLKELPHQLFLTRRQKIKEITSLTRCQCI